MINNSRDAIEVGGAGETSVNHILQHYPLIKRRKNNVDKGEANIVKLVGWNINNEFVPFNPDLYGRKGPYYRQN